MHNSNKLENSIKYTDKYLSCFSESLKEYNVDSGLHLVGL